MMLYYLKYATYTTCCKKLQYVFSCCLTVHSALFFCFKFDYSTRRQLSTGLFSATRSLQKNCGEGEVRSHDLPAWKQKRFKHQLGFEPGTYNLTEPPEVTKCTNGVGIKWSFNRISKRKNASQIMIFLPHLCGRKITTATFGCE